MTNFNTVARLAAAVILIACACTVGAQQAYPSKPVRFISPYAPGGSTTVLVQIIGQKLTESWGQQVLVDNRPGGNGIIAAEALARSPADGHTIMVTSLIHLVVPMLMQTPYDPFTDFAPVATVSSYGVILAAHPAVPAGSLQELIALAKSKPGHLNFSSGGNGTSTHLAGEMFNIQAGVKLQHIPYKGAGPAVTDLIGGQVQLTFIAPAATIPHIRSGKLKGIAISGERRISALPQVPTFTEAGLPGFEADSWYGILAAAKTPKTIVDQLSAAIAKTLAMPDVREKIAAQGMDAYYTTPEKFGTIMKADSIKYGNVIKTANIKIEN